MKVIRNIAGGSSGLNMKAGIYRLPITQGMKITPYIGETEDDANQPGPGGEYQAINTCMIGNNSWIDQTHKKR
jgi:hypothetical protein